MAITDPHPDFQVAAEVAERVWGQHWRKQVCQHYGMTAQTPTKWAKNGPPNWVLPAFRDALLAKKARALADAMSDLSNPDDLVSA